MGSGLGMRVALALTRHRLRAASGIELLLVLPLTSPEIVLATALLNLFVQADLQRAVIKSPVTGQVVRLSAQSVGAVVQAGQTIMDIVPNAEPLLI